MAHWYVYILKCGDGTLYTGIATDVERRFAEHASGVGSKYVRSRKPQKIVYRQEFRSRGMALKREVEIKKLTRRHKLALLA